MNHRNVEDWYLARYNSYDLIMARILASGYQSKPVSHSLLSSGDILILY